MTLESDIESLWLRYKMFAVVLADLAISFPRGFTILTKVWEWNVSPSTFTHCPGSFQSPSLGSARVQWNMKTIVGLILTSQCSQHGDVSLSKLIDLIMKLLEDNKAICSLLKLSFSWGQWVFQSCSPSVLQCCSIAVIYLVSATSFSCFFFFPFISACLVVYHEYMFKFWSSNLGWVFRTTM